MSDLKWRQTPVHQNTTPIQQTVHLQHAIQVKLLIITLLSSLIKVEQTGKKQ